MSTILSFFNKHSFLFSRNTNPLGGVRMFLILICLFFSVNCSSFLHKTGIMWERSKSDLSKKEIVLGEFRWVYLEGGNSEETVLTIHGFGGEKDHWTRFARTLTGRYRVISPDLPGFGENARIPERNYSILEQSKRLHEFAKSLGLKKYHIVGNSMGGSIAGVYAANYPDEVKTLTLIDTAGIKSPEPSLAMKMYLEGKPNPLLVNSVEDFDRLIRFSFVNPPYIPWPLKTYFAENSIRNREWNESIFRQIRGEGFPLEPLLPKIKAPTLVLWGDQDNIIDKSCTIVLEKKLKVKHKILILPEVGHGPMIEKPKETAEIWADWISEN